MSLDQPLDIVNAACSLIGHEPLQDLAEETLGGQSAALLYDKVVDFNLALEPFDFAHDLRQLSAVAGPAPASGYATVWDIPGARLGPPRWFTDDPSDPDRRFSRFVMMRGQVHATADVLWAYVPFRPEPWEWSALFRAATVTALAGDLALAIASDTNLSNRLKTDAYGVPSENYRGGQMRAAITANSQAAPPRKADWRNNPFERAWRG
uniref:hypothetical protein n=1 Tax=Stappia sp. TaxID=1870903 RepID=UPI003BA8DCF7